MDITPSNTQYRAISSIRQWWAANTSQVFLLSGYAGSGKTTLARIAVETLAKFHGRTLNVMCIAPTGKAAQVLSSKTGWHASTIHSAIYHVEENEETKEPKFVLKYMKDLPDLFVVDEGSMVGSRIAQDLLQFKRPILVLGDPAQLPPVNDEALFMTYSGVFLEEVHRQADGPVLRMAMKARLGEEIDFGGFPEAQRVKKGVVTDLILHGQHQLLCGINSKRRAAIRMIREARKYTDPLPYKGEPIVGLRNDPKNQFYNGTIGTLLSRTPSKKKLNLEIETPIGIIYPRVHAHGFLQTMEDDTIELPYKGGIADYAWALSVHKAQGSSWEKAVLLNDSKVFGEFQRQWLYTGITRAEKEIIIVG